MTAEWLSAGAAALLSLLFSYVPGLNGWYEQQTTVTKRLVMLGGLVLVTAGAVGLSCLGWFNMPVTCDQAGFQQVVTAFLAALMANQATYLISKG